MCLVADHDVQAVRLGLHELVEVLEQALHPRRALARVAAQRLSERPRAGRVQRRVPVPRQLPQQRQRDGALAAARPAEYDDRGLVVGLPRPRHGVTHQLVRQALLVEQDELFPVPDLRRGQRHQVLARPYRAGHQPVRGAGARLGRQVLAQELEELAAPLLRVQPPPALLLEVEQVLDLDVDRVVQVRHARHPLVVVGEHAQIVGGVLAVPLDLQPGMQLRPTRRVLHEYEVRVLFPFLGVRPLLELDDDVRVLAGARVRAGQDHVGAAAGQRQLVLDQHFHRVEAGVTQVIGQDRQTVGPGAALGLRRQLPGRMLHMVADPIGQRALPGKLDNTGHGLTERRQRTTPGQHELLVRWGHVRSPEARRSALAPSLYRVAPTPSQASAAAL